ncbi:hypothetical protein [Marinirhabdus gelatinilytica]|uniref:Uncharacterized protein n=1 Tax=Marinirhabdus gelatinilytica TaxID=1703343 RepID=A0A370QJ41_9FLAO|nr:hypothetical protein [Marinirhabdus gelatinilytica]RDK88361.1 hypothetical protein C8D94_101232 [Marinirhabdus gelatinilytica]
MSNQKSFFSKKIQEIHAKPEGEILESSNTIFKLNTAENLYELHPFFESLQTELQNQEVFGTNLAFPCVHLNINGKEAICDITIKKEPEFLAILLFDYSQHYEHLHEAAQEKKSAILQEQEHNLRRKHLEEKEAYLGFMKERIDDKIIGGLEYIILKLGKLKTSEPTPEQLQMIEEIEKSVGKFHLKAIQIREELDFDFDS